MFGPPAETKRGQDSFNELPRPHTLGRSANNIIDESLKSIGGDAPQAALQHLGIDLSLCHGRVSVAS